MADEAIRSPYVDYEYYTDTYHGSKITKEDFLGVEDMAESFLDQITFGRIRRLDSVPDCVKKAVCCAAEMIAANNSKLDSNVKSESNDGYSVSYADASSYRTLQGEMYRTAKMYLANTRLLNRGWVEEYDAEQ